MYLIIVYDIEEERVNKVCKFLRQHLTWVQNSVFEGELTKGEFEEVRLGLSEIIDDNTDSILFYIVPSEKGIEKIVLGKEKAEVTRII